MNGMQENIPIEALGKPIAKKKKKPSSEIVFQRKTIKIKSLRLRATGLDVSLWGGYSRYTLPELESLKVNDKASIKDRTKAAWYLKGWYFMEEDYLRAYENIAYITLLDSTIEKKRIVAEVQCLIELGRYVEAQDRITQAIDALGEISDFLLLQAAVAARIGSDGEAEQLRCLNSFLEGMGLATIEKKDPSQPLHFYNFTSRAEAKITDQVEKVSIVMPAYCAAETVRLAVESLLKQTWKNIEVIVVDDLSTDNTCEVLDQLATEDLRVMVIKKQVNEGAYMSRNHGLQFATGDLIMVHDSDDWSHPQKIEMQVASLRANPSLVASMSQWLRVDEYLRPAWKGRQGGLLFSPNFSSLLVKREVHEKLGPWDCARVSADAEFRSRIQNYYGEEAIEKLSSDYLLSLSLSREDSLTRTKATHVKTLYFGLRWLYRDAYLYWHAKESFKESPSISGERRFPVPRGNSTSADLRKVYDVIVISDFAMKGGPYISSLNFLRAAGRMGQKIAVVHWRKYGFLANASLNASFYDACLKFGIDILAPGDVVDASAVIIGNPTLLQYRPDFFPVIKATHVVVLVNQFSERMRDGSDPQYDPMMARGCLKTLFGHEGTWVAISERVRALMKKDGRFPRPYKHLWGPMMDTALWSSVPLRWRGALGSRPFIGRHGKDSLAKWPAEKRDIVRAYGVNSENCEVQILGGASHAIKKLGKEPDNWQVFSFNKMSVMEFLKGLDFFVHFPHEDYIEEFGQAVIEAMAVGIPAILPPSYREIFGDAASYARPREVESRIAKLWASESDYLAQAERGRAFVIEKCDLRRLKNRLQKLLAGE